MLAPTGSKGSAECSFKSHHRNRHNSCLSQGTQQWEHAAGLKILQIKIVISLLFSVDEVYFLLSWKVGTLLACPGFLRRTLIQMGRHTLLCTADTASKERRATGVSKWRNTWRKGQVSGAMVKMLLGIQTFHVPRSLPDSALLLRHNRRASRDGLCSWDPDTHMEDLNWVLWS